MKNLLLMRHASAADKLLGQMDIDRELTLFGERQAGEAGVWIKSQQLVPQLIMCSPSVRTLATCQTVLERLGKQVPVHREKVIYDGSEKDLLHLVQEAGEQVDTLLLIGHNPSISFFASELAREDISFSPSNVAALQFNISFWDEVKPAGGKLSAFYKS